MLQDDAPLVNSSNKHAPNELEAVSDNELEAAAGGVSADGQDLGKNVSIDGSQNKTIAQLDVKPGETLNIG